MAKPKIQVGDLVRDMTAEEYEQWQTDKIEAEAQAQAQVTKAETRESALNKLGLTTDEIVALFG